MNVFRHVGKPMKLLHNYCSALRAIDCTRNHDINRSVVRCANRRRRWSSAAQIKLFDGDVVRLRPLRRQTADVDDAVWNVAVLPRLIGVDVIATSLDDAGRHVVVGQLPQHAVQTVHGQRVLTLVVHRDRETSAFRYTQLADRRRDVIATTSGRQVDHLSDTIASFSRQVTNLRARCMRFVISPCTQ